MYIDVYAMLILGDQLRVHSLGFIFLVAASGHSTSPDLVRGPKPPYSEREI
jgi:hypothetical protein